MSWLKRTQKPILIYTDGSCLPQGDGGWAAILFCGEERVEISGYVAASTNNRMEMMAALMALKILPAGAHVFLHTDSRYLQRGIQYWVPKWQSRDWTRMAGGQVVNQDLWEALHEETTRMTVSWLWVKGHQQKEVHNERCDVLARQAAVQKAGEFPANLLDKYGHWCYAAQVLSVGQTG